MSKMILMRGGPGSGKSTYAKKLRDAASGTGRQVPVICSADDSFVDDDGVYRFNPDRIGQAHGACLRKCAEVIVLRRAPVIIDNTNGKPDAMKPYLALALAFGYEVEVVHVKCDREVAWARQTHDVPRCKFDSIYTCLEQQQVPSMYRKNRRVTCTEVLAYGCDQRPSSQARCVSCTGNLVYDQIGQRMTSHPADTCNCEEGAEIPGEPNSRPPCNCGVSMGIRSDHESQCAGAYIQRRK